MCCYGQLVINLLQFDLSVSLFSFVQFSSVLSVVSFSLQHHRLQHARLPYPSPTLGSYSRSCPSTWWCHPTISFCLPLLFLPSIFPNIRVFSNESVVPIRSANTWSFSFSISASSEYSGLTFFRMDGLDLLAVQETLKSLLLPGSSPSGSREFEAGTELASGKELFN